MPITWPVCRGQKTTSGSLFWIRRHRTQVAELSSKHLPPLRNLCPAVIPDVGVCVLAPWQTPRGFRHFPYGASALEHTWGKSQLNPRAASLLGTLRCPERLGLFTPPSLSPSLKINDIPQRSLGLHFCPTTNL